eukprot:CAMPEP_0119079982 /NCGR_PEP_ID=MMETSP1178-20130426/110045_1 /TAXON_ID=33656 /ORGANISM="unid sp, Strain CCMP2000" /LENGTH=132 /DNA_ID=CAMNT_0007062543 /DNA_START=117 /DNA_END=516 /DNA_ORIENTATION=-
MCLQAASNCSARALIGRGRAAVNSACSDRARTVASSSSRVTCSASSAAASRAAVSLTNARSLLSEAVAASTTWPVESCDETKPSVATHVAEARHGTVPAGAQSLSLVAPLQPPHAGALVARAQSRSDSSASG